MKTLGMAASFAAFLCCGMLAIDGFLGQLSQLMAGAGYAMLAVVCGKDGPGKGCGGGEEEAPLTGRFWNRIGIGAAGFGRCRPFLGKIVSKL